MIQDKAKDIARLTAKILSQDSEITALKLEI